jgi:excisionase family DNA binding protein
VHSSPIPNYFWEKFILAISIEMCDERLLTIEQLAERLQYSADWIRTQVKAGRLPAIRFNRRAWRFHWATVLAALQKLQ